MNCIVRVLFLDRCGSQAHQHPTSTLYNLGVFIPLLQLTEFCNFDSANQAGRLI